MAFQPLQGWAEAQLVQVYDQVNGAASALSTVPVHEPGSGDGEHAPAGVPLVRVVAVGLGANEPQHRHQGHPAQPLGSLPPAHDSAESLGRRPTHSRMLKTWLHSVNRSMSAAVRWSFLRKEPHSRKPRLEVMRVGFFLCRRCIRVKKSPTWTGSVSM